MEAISIAHRETETWSDWVALSMVRLLRFGMDTATGYRHDKEVAKGTKDPVTGSKNSWFAMNERKWLVRFVFLESVAGVPGMVGGVLRHLRSLRRLKRDNGWLVRRRHPPKVRETNLGVGSKPFSRKHITNACTS